MEDSGKSDKMRKICGKVNEISLHNPLSVL